MNAKETLAQIKELGLLRAGNLQEKLNAMAVSFEEELIELRGKCDELQLSHDNIINSLGIKGDGPVSKLVLDNFLALAAEVDAYRQFVKDLGIVCTLNAPNSDHLLDYYRAQGVDEFTSELAGKIRLAGGEDGCSLVNYGEYADHLESKGEDFAANLRAGRKG